MWLNLNAAGLTTRPDDRSHDNSRFASSGGDRQVFLWDVMTGQTIRRISGHMGKIFAVEFNEDASVLASGELLSLSDAQGGPEMLRPFEVRTTRPLECGI